MPQNGGGTCSEICTRHEQKLLKALADNDRLLKANSELAAQLEQFRRTATA